MAETIVLDPSAVATSRTAVDITPWLTDEGVDWGDGAIEAYLADGAIGSSPVDYRLPNRQIVAPMKLLARGTVTFETIRRQLQAKVALFQKEGGWISRVTAAGGTVFADVVNASLTLGGDWMQANTTAAQRADVHAELKLETIPDFYGSEITLDDKTETTALALTTVLKLSAADAVISGDYPARVRVVVDEDDGDTQLGLMWGFRSRYYDSASTASLTYEAEALTPLDTAAAQTLFAASGGTAVTHQNVRTDWTAVLSTQAVGGGAQMTHKGTYRVWARFATSALTEGMRARLVWRTGTLVNAQENDAVNVPAAGSGIFYWRDLGEVRLDPAPTGTHQWEGRIEAIAETSTSPIIWVDAVHFVPVDDGYGVLRSPQTIPTITSYAGSDSFTSTTSGGTLNGRVAPTGGTWATSGDATDFVFADTFNTSVGETIKRTATGATNGKFGILGATNYTNVQVEVSANVDLDDTGDPALTLWPRLGVIARWTDSSNHLRAFIRHFAVGGTQRAMIVIQEVLAGVTTQYGADTFALSNTEWLNSAWRVILTVTDNGSAIAYMKALGQNVGTGGGAIPNGTVMTSKSIQLGSLATGGVLATGKIGIFDHYAGVTASVDRYYDDFRVASIPTLDATMYPNQSCELRTDGILREGSAGNIYNTAPHIGDLPRLPVSGLENRKVEIYIKGSRGDFADIADTGIDNISAQVFYRPSWVFLS